jgi:hypothetical protein
MSLGIDLRPQLCPIQVANGLHKAL